MKEILEHLQSIFDKGDLDDFHQAIHLMDKESLEKLEKFEAKYPEVIKGIIEIHYPQQSIFKY